MVPPSWVAVGKPRSNPSTSGVLLLTPGCRDFTEQSGRSEVCVSHERYLQDAPHLAEKSG